MKVKVTSKMILLILVASSIVFVGVNASESDPVFDWYKTYGTEEFDDAYDITVDDGELLLTGRTTVSGRGLEYYLIKLDMEGNETWSAINGTEKNEQGTS